LPLGWGPKGRWFNPVVGEITNPKVPAKPLPAKGRQPSGD
jgi:hypothetical protein